MPKHTVGSVSRQAQRQATKRRRQAERERRQRARQSWPPAKAGRTTSEPKAQLQARSYLVRKFWEHLNLSHLLHKAGVKKKFKGLPAVTLMVVALTFGVCNTNSVSDLAAKAQADPVLLGACWAQGLERKQCAGTASRPAHRHLSACTHKQTHRRGVAIGDDTTVFKLGKKMPYVTPVYLTNYDLNCAEIHDHRTQDSNEVYPWRVLLQETRSESGYHQYDS